MISSALLAIALAALANGSPVPQGESRLLQPTNGPVPASCHITYQGMFAIAAIKAVGVPIPSGPVKRQVGQQGDGQATGAQATVPVATQISDAQPQLPTAQVVTQISDAQPQAPIKTNPIVTMMPISQIHDGQPQAYYQTATVVTQISDAQPQAPGPVATPVTQISDAQPQAPTGSAVPPVSQLPDAQPQATGTTPTNQTPNNANTGGSGPLASMVACRTDSTLVLDVNNGRLVDGKGRIGYIADNFQFQFDAGIPQTGAIITTGFNVCDDGTLGLGSSNIFWQCLSGTFYNLYDRHWAPQCEPVYLRIVALKDC